MDGERHHALEEPTSLNIAGTAAGAHGGEHASVKIEGRQRSPAWRQNAAKVWRRDRLLQSRPVNFVPQRTGGDASARCPKAPKPRLAYGHRKWQ